MMKHFNIFKSKEEKSTSITYQYMVEFKLPEQISQEFMSRIPDQRKVVNRYFRQGKMKTYALSLESSKMWAIFNVHTELELMELLAELPLTTLVDLDISCLTIYNMPSAIHPEFSLN
jgi:muconolactone delta-isomerase